MSAYPAIPVHPNGWGKWTVGQLQALIDDVLTSPFNDDRQAGLGLLLDEARAVLLQNPWNTATNARAVKLGMVEAVGHALDSRALWTKEYLRDLWGALTATDPGPWDIAANTFRNLPGAARDVGAYVGRTSAEFAKGATEESNPLLWALGIAAVASIATAGGVIKLGALSRQGGKDGQ